MSATTLSGMKAVNLSLLSATAFSLSYKHLCLASSSLPRALYEEIIGDSPKVVDDSVNSRPCCLRGVQEKIFLLFRRVLAIMHNDILLGSPRAGFRSLWQLALV